MQLCGAKVFNFFTATLPLSLGLIATLPLSFGLIATLPLSLGLIGTTPGTDGLIEPLGNLALSNNFVFQSSQLETGESFEFGVLRTVGGAVLRMLVSFDKLLGEDNADDC